MLSVNEFYENGLGDRLANPLYHPRVITEFLQEELRIVNSIQSSIDLLIEVGCMHGRYLDWAITHKKLYIGIDLVQRYIEAGRRAVAERGLSKEIYQFVAGNAEEMARLLGQQHLHIEHDRCLLLFPFNSFGNMLDEERVIASLRECELPFFISSYQTTEYATACRKEYYTRCGYKDVRFLNTEKGIYFSSSDGLHSIAYYPKYLQKLFDDHKLLITIEPTPPINVSYMKRCISWNLAEEVST